jgi:hypothetical protein
VRRARLLQLVSQFGQVAGDDRMRPRAGRRSVGHVPDSAIRGYDIEDVVASEAFPQPQDFGLIGLAGRGSVPACLAGMIVSSRAWHGNQRIDLGTHLQYLLSWSR